MSTSELKDSSFGENSVENVVVETVDARGMQCPMPLLKAKLGLKNLEVGQVLEVFATDKGSFRDFQVFTEQSNHELLRAEESNGEYHYLIRKGELPSI